MAWAVDIELGNKKRVGQAAQGEALKGDQGRGRGESWRGRTATSMKSRDCGAIAYTQRKKGICELTWDRKKQRGKEMEAHLGRCWH